MYANKRKMKRTKQEQLKVVESMNRNALDILIYQHNRLVNEVVTLQKNQLAMMNVLKRQRLIDDFVIHQELERIDEMEAMSKKAIIIDPNKPDTGKPEPGPEEKKP